ncbi:MAG TPA: hypothetical protein VEK07_09600 [Polyangiaceae bacterium]|nr:hypothetical protein [Polyangiaceae bacterium]
MQLRVGCELIYRCAPPTLMLLTLRVHYTRASDMVGPDHLVTQPSLPIRQSATDSATGAIKSSRPRTSPRSP